MKIISLAARKTPVFTFIFLSLGFLPAAMPGARADSWESRSPAPGARAAHSAVWTGREMIVWGGGIDGNFLNTGGRYLPATDSWRETSLLDAPSPRWFHAAVWTGYEMIIWGGRPNFFGDNNLNDGGRYNPATDTWTPVSPAGAPIPRSQCAAVWTGSEMIVWGGETEGGVPLSDGARYDPETGVWTPLPPSGLAPRMEPTAIWTGSEMIVFGGVDATTPGWTTFGDGARYNPATDTWTPLPAGGAPSARTAHTAVWTGERMVVWGGYELPARTLLDTGAGFDVGANIWTPVPPGEASPGRFYHAAVWTGTEMIVWGGQDIFGTMLNTGARYKPASGTWTATSLEGAAGPRQFWRPDLGIWTGSGMLICAGSDYPASLDSTFLYRPVDTNNLPPPRTNCFPAPAGLVGWWRGEGNANDAAGHHDGTANGGVSYEPGIAGQAFRIDGVQGRVNLPDAEEFKLTEALSIEGWIKLINRDSGLSIFMRGDDRPGLDPYALGVGDGRIVFAISDDVDADTVSAPLPLGQWKHVAGTFDAANESLKLYLDGALVGQTHTTRRPARDLEPAFNPGLAIGNVSGNWINFPWDGWIDEISLYNRALTDAEVLGLFRARQNGKCLTPQPTNCVAPPHELVGWWRAEGNAQDAAGTHHGTLVGNVTYAPGMVGQGFHFDGSGSYVRIPNDPSLDFPEELTLELWYRHDGSPEASYGLVSTRGTEVGPVNYAISVIPIGIGPYFNDPEVAVGDDADVGGTFEASRYLPVPSSGQFHHLGVTFRQTTPGELELKTFIDGVLVRTKRLAAQLSHGVSDAAIVIGRSAEYGGELFEGVIDEVTIYHRALSGDEIRAIAAAGRAGKCPRPGMPAVAHDLVRDYSTNANPAGPWRYGWKSTLDGNLTLFDHHDYSPQEGGGVFDYWQKNPFEPSGVWHNVSGVTVTNNDGQGIFPPGIVWFGPGHEGSADNYGVIRFTVPSGGGGLYRLFTSVSPVFNISLQGDTDFHVLSNGVEIFSRFLAGEQEAAFNESLLLAVGDTVDFAIGRGADNQEYASALRIQATLHWMAHEPPGPQHCEPAPSGLVGWWPAEGNASDVVGASHERLLGGATYATGMVGRAFAFHSPSNGVRIPGSALLDVGAGIGMTVELWINPDDVTEPGPLVEWNNGADLFGTHLWILPFQGGDGLQPSSTAVAGPGQLYVAFTLLGQWYQMITDADVLVPHAFQHVAVTYSKRTGTGRLYRNGTLVAEQFLGEFTPQTAYDVYFGLRPAGPEGDPTQLYHGLMDEVSIYNRALTAEEIAAIAQAGSMGKCRQPSSLDQLFSAVNGAPPSVDREPLLAILQTVRLSIARVNILAAINQLRAFQALVQTHVAPVDGALARLLSSLAEATIATLDPVGSRQTELEAMAARPMHVQQVSPASVGVRVEGWAMPGTACELQRSTNLRDWTTAGAPVEVEDGHFQFTDPRPPLPGIFYRFRKP